jgi:hypothetical protein
MADNTEIRPFRVDIPQATLDDLRDCLARVRWTDPDPGTSDWEYGVPLDAVQRLADYWLAYHDARLAIHQHRDAQQHHDADRLGTDESVGSDAGEGARRGGPPCSPTCWPIRNARGTSGPWPKLP